MSLHEVNHLVHHYGLGLVFTVVALQAVGAPLPGTTALIAASLYAAGSNGLPIVGVIVAGALGALLGTTAGFVLGRWRGAAVLLWLARLARQPPERVQALRTELADHGLPFVFIARFVSGLRNVVGLLAGATGMPFRRFFVVTAVAATAWALMNGLEYYYLGHAIAGAGTWLQVVLVLVGLAWLALTLTLLRRRALRAIRCSTPPTG